MNYLLLINHHEHKVVKTWKLGIVSDSDIYRNQTEDACVQHSGKKKNVDVLLFRLSGNSKDLTLLISFETPVFDKMP